MNAEAVLPGLGRIWVADFGSDGPCGRFAVELDLISSTRLPIVVPHGRFKGHVGTVDYRTVEVGPGLFIVRWREPEQGTCVTHFQTEQLRGARKWSRAKESSYRCSARSRRPKLIDSCGTRFGVGLIRSLWAGVVRRSRRGDRAKLEANGERED